MKKERSASCWLCHEPVGTRKQPLFYRITAEPFVADAEPTLTTAPVALVLVHGVFARPRALPIHVLLCASCGQTPVRFHWKNE